MFVNIIGLLFYNHYSIILIIILYNSLINNQNIMQKSMSVKLYIPYTFSFMLKYLRILIYK